MTTERMICCISYCSLTLGCIAAGATLIALPLVYWEPRIPGQTVTLLFILSLLLLSIGCHYLDRRDDVRRGDWDNLDKPNLGPGTLLARREERTRSPFA